jgi:hypothetical protein
MASKGFEPKLAELELSEPPINGNWPFEDMRKEITSIAATMPRRDERLTALRKGQKVRL